MEEKLLLARINDLFKMCDKHCCGRFSGFLNEGEQAVVYDKFYIPTGYNTGWFGGYENAKRRVFGVFPEWETPDEFPIRALRITHTYKKELSHRDYLGSIMGLGIDRGKVGDILINDMTAYAFVLDEILGYIKENLNKIGNIGVRVEECDIGDVTYVPDKTIRMEITAASERLDAVISAMLNISRSAAADLIKSGKVGVNHREALDGAGTISEKDVISVRGFGRYIYLGSGGQTRKGRMHITVEKYI